MNNQALLNVKEVDDCQVKTKKHYSVTKNMAIR